MFFFFWLFFFPFSDDAVWPGFCVHDVVTLVVYAGGFAGMVSVLSNVFSCATLLSNKGKTTANFNHHPLFVCFFSTCVRLYRKGAISGLMSTTNALIY